MGLFGKMLKKNRSFDNSPEALQKVKWGIASPLMLRLTEGIESIRAYGTFSCRIIDQSKLEKEGFVIEEANLSTQLKPYLTDLLVASFRAVLGRESTSMKLEDLIGSAGELARAVKDDTAAVLSEKGLELSSFVVMKIVKA